MIGRIAGLAAVSAFLSGCAGMMPQPTNWNDPVAVASKVTVESDNFKKTRSVKGPNCASVFGDSVFLRSVEDQRDPGKSFIQIYVMDYYSDDWRFYHSAYDSNGNQLDFISIDREVGSCSKYGCSHYEHMAMNVSRKYLEQAIATGVSFQVSGKAGKEQFLIPGGYIQGFLNVLDGKTAAVSQ